MKQPSRIDWMNVLSVMLIILIVITGVANIAHIVAKFVEEKTPPPPTAELEISVEDMERIASMFAGEARRIKDARMDALEERIERLEEEGE